MFADRLKTLSPSPTLAIQAKAKAMRAADRHIRLSYAADIETIRQGLARMEAAVRSLGG